MTKRLIGLDILRSVAIIFVLMSHGFYLIYDTIPERVSLFLMSYGLVGVHLFFVLSGYLVGQIFIKEVILIEGSYRSKLFNFWKRRWFRTLPNYFLFLIIYTIIMHISLLYPNSAFIKIGFADYNILVRFPFFLQNLVSENPKFFAQAWSLSVEEWFYLSLPFFFMIMGLFGVINQNTVITRHTLFLLLLLIMIKWLCYFTVPEFYSHFKVIFCLDKIMIGVLLAALKLFSNKYLSVYRNTSLFLGISFFLISNFISIKYILVKNPLVYAEIWNDTFISVSFALIVFYFIDIKLPENIVSRIIRIVSISSYSMYLCHFLVLMFVADIILNYFSIFDSIVGRWFVFLLYFTITTLISYILFTFFEKPVMELRDHKIFNKNIRNAH